MKLSSMLESIKVLEIRGSTDRVVSGVAYDSRKVGPDGLFVAIPGERHDGFEYIEDAIKRGAGVIVLPRGRFPNREVTQVQVEQARQALADLADIFYGHPSGRLALIGLTGTNGKTTTAFMIRDILAAAGLAPGLLGTVQYEIGARVIPATRTTPESVDVQAFLDQMLRAGCRSAVMEVSSHALAQDRVRRLEFDAAVLTNLTRDHLDYHGTMEQYYEAKRRLFTTLGSGSKKGVALVNGDDPWGMKLARDPEVSSRVLTYGLGDRVDIRATNLALTPGGSRFTVESPWGACVLDTPLLGRFNLFNALAAFSATRALGVEPDVIRMALAHRGAVPGRLEEVATGRGWRVFIDYAHTDDALANVLETLRGYTTGQLRVVFGCGGNRDRSKRPLMGRVAARLADHTLLTSDNPRDEEPGAIIREIQAGFDGHALCEVVEDRAEAIARALASARSGDVILVAGKGHETTQECRGVYSLFDDRQVVRTWLQQNGAAS